MTQIGKCVTTFGLTPDSFLGSSSERYFSSCFKDVEHHIKDVRIEGDDLYANFTIQWPINWSQKKGVSLQPHVGTLDFFLIASRLSEIYFKIVNKIPENQISEMWISEFHCKVGNKCNEVKTNSCKCQLTSEISKDNQIEYDLKITIAETVVVLKVLSPYKNKKNQPSVKKQTDFGQESYYASYYKEASRNITNIRQYTEDKSIFADFELNPINDLSYKGLGSKYMPCITFCDLILVCGQLSQILLYQIDNTNRENASNLWLRNIHCKYRKPINKKTNVSVKVKKSKMVKLKESSYNCSDLVFDFNNGDLIADCSSAYQPFTK